MPMKFLSDGVESEFADGVKCTYTPFQDGPLLGYKMEVNGKATFVTLCPSDCGDGPDLFVYHGRTGNPEQDEVVCFLTPDNGEQLQP